jgi:hypothetical protein
LTGVNNNILNLFRPKNVLSECGFLNAQSTFKQEENARERYCGVMKKSECRMAMKWWQQICSFTAHKKK